MIFFLPKRSFFLLWVRLIWKYTTTSSQSKWSDTWLAKPLWYWNRANVRRLHCCPVPVPCSLRASSLVQITLWSFVWLYTASILYVKFSPWKCEKSTLPFRWFTDEMFTMRAGDDFFKRSDKELKRNAKQLKKKTESAEVRSGNRNETDVMSDLGADWWAGRVRHGWWRRILPVHQRWFPWEDLQASHLCQKQRSRS